MRVMLLGASGLVGRAVLDRLLEDPRCTAVVAPGRRGLPVTAPTLEVPVLAFDRLPQPPQVPAWARVDAVICALGTTLAQAGSREAFEQVDRSYPLAFARLAQAGGADVFVLNSAAGADAGSRLFYNRVKGALEQDLRDLGFASLTLVRPGLIGGQRSERRPAERLGQIVLGLIGPVLPRGWRINPAERIAEAMVEAALAPLPGEHIVPAHTLAG
ncbi:NAD-dependent dehydratase [Stenotrophomonas sp. C3(2023)]|uniref:NAD-dependent dehydratase n=1 Tax=Stenotrophomonas sp. C3(2023) TaxID=3080277 RepID=UPI00293D138F|nr:NAD-dependent dehydratase [Stenotrophomonas sp. C3(2023)]MDV3469986.1 NAD-dependent dehydratase [Stenotrophomonas sp. C3(2023)]